MAPGLENVGDLAQGYGAFAHGAQALIDGQLFFLAYAQGLVQVAPGLENVGDSAQGHGAFAHVAQAFEDG